VEHSRATGEAAWFREAIALAAALTHGTTFPKVAMISVLSPHHPGALEFHIFLDKKMKEI
jgi:hypothetical protein